MISPRNWPTFPPHKIRTPPLLWLTFRHPFATCHILCQSPQPLPPQAAASTLAPPPSFIEQGPGPSRKGNERARAPLTPTTSANEDPKYLIPFYDTKLGNAFGDPAKHARLYTHSYEAGEY